MHYLWKSRCVLPLRYRSVDGNGTTAKGDRREAGGATQEAERAMGGGPLRAELMTVTVDSSGFIRMVNDLARLSGKDFSTVLKHEAARVIEKAIAFTPKGKLKFKTDAKEEAERRTRTHPTDTWPRVSVTKTGKIWFGEQDDRYVQKIHPRISGDRPVWHIMNDANRRWNSQRWIGYKSLDAERIRERNASVKTIAAERKAKRLALGLSKRSWYQIAQDLRLPLRSVPQYVTRAKPSNGKEYKNGKGSEHTLTSGGFFLRLENNYPALTSTITRKGSKGGKARSMNGHHILQKAINTRLSAFEHELKNDVFKNLKLRAARHPGVFVY